MERPSCAATFARGSLCAKFFNFAMSSAVQRRNVGLGSSQHHIKKSKCCGLREVPGRLAGAELAHFWPERFPISRLNSPGLCAAFVELRVPRTGSTPSIVPDRNDQTVYLVVDRDGGLGISDFETTIADLTSGQFNDPVRVIAFNTLEHWTQNVSRDVALEIQCRCDIDGHDVPETLRDFVDSYARPDRQLALRLL